MGNGGPNPISIPPTALAQYEFGYVTDLRSEWSVGIVPGLFYGIRTKDTKGPYFGFGGGLVIGANGTGPGVYTAFGANLFCGSVCFVVDYRQALAITGDNLISPYALRIGVSLTL
jgi:hypothetical protein